jgi:predicted O-methyltransferase YrrM
MDNVPTVASRWVSTQNTRKMPHHLSLRKQAKKYLFKCFSLADRLGVHILPRHFYSPIPDHSWLKEHKEFWTGKADLQGVEWNLDRQMDWLSQMCEPYYAEVRGLGFFETATSEGWGRGFGAIESQVLHCVVRSLAPPRILEIGSGVSTACMIEAVKRNEEENKPSTKITCIEPYPKPAFKGLPNVQHIQELCQTVSKSVFTELKAGDLLFIDSSHAVKTGSDVVRIYLEIIPSLASGVVIHIHDIFLPYLYPRDVLTHFWGWQETVLLAALMTSNPQLSVLAGLSALHYDRPKELQALLKDYQPQANEEGLNPNGATPDGHFPSSLWLRSNEPRALR